VSVAPAGAALRLEDFDYELPSIQIAQYPLPERGSSRLMVLDRATRSWTHTQFGRLPDWLRNGDVLVRNDARVIRARLRGERPRGGEVEVLLLKRETTEPHGEVWSCLARPGRRLRRGESAFLRGGIEATWLDEADRDGIRRVRLAARRPILEILEAEGEVPLPPYIQRAPTGLDTAAYQTVYARHPAAVAAPTAGLHFTAAMFAAITARGIEVASLTLDVGAGTFLPIREDPSQHRVAPEHVEIPAATAQAVNAAKRTGRRVVAVGTTTVRALEGLLADAAVDARAGDVSLFITPGYRFAIVDALVTNFHLPRSTLLMMVAAFAGLELTLAAYRAAVCEGYRFYSYGDAMLIL
jgi:S-adenosylmethionine:tRNA ribosyltransferase-isomerase